LQNVHIAGRLELFAILILPFVMSTS